MPRRPKKPCAYPGCPNITEGSYCVDHKAFEPKPYEKKSCNPFYSTRGWKEKRREFLGEHPFCVCCGRPAEIVDHIVPIRKGGEPLDDRNLQSFCWSFRWLGLCDRITFKEKGKAAVRFRSGFEIEVEY